MRGDFFFERLTVEFRYVFKRRVVATVFLIASDLWPGICWDRYQLILIPIIVYAKHDR